MTETNRDLHSFDLEDELLSKIRRADAREDRYQEPEPERDRVEDDIEHFLGTGDFRVNASQYAHEERVRQKLSARGIHPIDPRDILRDVIPDFGSRKKEDTTVHENTATSGDRENKTGDITENELSKWSEQLGEHIDWVIVMYDLLSQRVSRLEDTRDAIHRADVLLLHERFLAAKGMEVPLHKLQGYLERCRDFIRQLKRNASGEIPPTLWSDYQVLGDKISENISTAFDILRAIWHSDLLTNLSTIEGEMGGGVTVSDEEEFLLLTAGYEDEAKIQACRMRYDLPDDMADDEVLHEFARRESSVYKQRLSYESRLTDENVSDFIRLFEALRSHIRIIVERTKENKKIPLQYPDAQL